MGRCDLDGTGGFWRVTAVASLAMALAGCAVGGFGAIGRVAVAPPPALAPEPVSYGAFLEGPVGQKLAGADRDKALAAEQDALAAGQRKAWRGTGGTFGYVEPAAPGSPLAATADGAPPVAGGDVCRTFTSTIYIGGRPQVGHGRGCPSPDGTYRIVG